MERDRSSERIGRHLPLHPADYVILLALTRHERHGYGILQEVATAGGGGVDLDAGNLYRRLRRMLAAEWVERLDLPPEDGGDSRRRFYRLTEIGRAVAAAETARLQRLVGSAPARSLAGEVAS